MPFRRFGGLCRHLSGEDQVVKVPGIYFDGQTSKQLANLQKGGCPTFVGFTQLENGGCLEHDWLIVMVNIVLLIVVVHRLQTNNNRLIVINHI